MKNKKMIFFIALSFFCLTLFVYGYHRSAVSLPFKCLYTTQYHYMREGESLNVHLIHDVRIYSKDSAYILLDGHLRSSTNTYKINRVILLGDGEISQGSTFRFNKTEVKPSHDDNVPAELVHRVLNEYSLTPDTMQIDIFPLADKSFLIGGPSSFLSICLRY
ncbi:MULTISPECIES: hypothetical protein [unclassified Pantoea]|uniref:hypothetical protein n=1 Tax=unclassified Pantoea TaxID=2630326 RepID=UPI0001E0B3B7|nr:MULTISPECIES: hypothetical protein [unclassified Pantoea]EFM19335.1 hypothetical protein PanABDRAFT_2486 [Pantoea sp. aB]QNQ60050.1 hypothetical protein IAI47_07360 [Pantoea sp. MT58]